MKRGMLRLGKQDIEKLLHFVDMAQLNAALVEPADEVTIELSEDDVEKILDSLPVDQLNLRVKLQQFLTQLRFGDTP
jgi:hypothetical protein